MALSSSPISSIGAFLLALAATQWAAADDPGKAPRKIPETGDTAPEFAPLDELMRTFVRENEMPGAAIAVAKQGELIYSRGFGYADLAEKQPVQPAALFRIASLSKPVTAVAVMQLVDRGKLRLDDRVVDLLTIEPSQGKTRDRRWNDVTVRHLLQHTGGWDRDASFDPMFRSVAIAKEFNAPPPATPEQIIRSMAGRPLDFNPGENYAYSNFGYCLLGRIVERASRMNYERFVRTQVLKPLGITRMQLARTLPAGRARGEVQYRVRPDATGPSVFAPQVGQTVPQPYGAWCLESMDANGGWIASAPDLVRFASAFHDPANCPCLSPTAIEQMYARPPGPLGLEADGSPKPSFYACGWNVRPVGPVDADGRFQRSNAWHMGGLPGTSTLLVRRHDGLAWAVLFNTREAADGEAAAKKIDPLMHTAVDAALANR